MDCLINRLLLPIFKLACFLMTCGVQAGCAPTFPMLPKGEEVFDKGRVVQTSITEMNETCSYNVLEGCEKYDHRWVKFEAILYYDLSDEDEENSYVDVALFSPRDSLPVGKEDDRWYDAQDTSIELIEGPLPDDELRSLAAYHGKRVSVTGLADSSCVIEVHWTYALQDDPIYVMPSNSTCRNVSEAQIFITQYEVTEIK